ncbi:MAG: hypothetical protein IJ009_02070 [Clostridia bacterium]|nr:hypothetical protein [Clostridia bacterium]
MKEYQTSERYQDMALIRTFLHEGEEILWTGQPYASAYRPPFSGVLFSLFFLGFAVFWMVAAASASVGFSLFGLPFVAVGVFIFCSVTFGTRAQMKHTLYAVTDRRALIIRETRRGTDCTEYVFSRMQGVSMDRVQGNVGCIRFRDDLAYEGVNYRIGTTRHHIPTADVEMRIAFLMIDNVHAVYRLISERIGQN